MESFVFSGPRSYSEFIIDEAKTVALSLIVVTDFIGETLAHHTRSDCIKVYQTRDCSGRYH